MQILVIGKQITIELDEACDQYPDDPDAALIGPRVSELTRLLPKTTLNCSKHDDTSKNLPILSCLHDARLRTALLLTFTEALIVGT